jgi:ubiquinone/menaquinone biosynthesis C-methylase UbiE
VKINLCCGPNMFPGWLNVDGADMEREYLRHLRDAPDGFVWPEPQRELAAWVKAGKPLDFMVHDVRKGLPWPDNSVDAIYIGQAIEHFNRRTEAPKLLSECLRVLKPGAPIRLTTPDIQHLASVLVRGDNYGGLGRFCREQPEFYAESLPEDQFAYLLFGASGPNCTQQNYEGHFHAYSSRSLLRLLRDCGFNTEEKTSGYSHVASRMFHDTRDCGMSHSFAIEAVKP